MNACTGNGVQVLDVVRGTRRMAVHICKLVLITPYGSLQELAVRQFPYFPVRLLLTDKYDPGAAPLA